MIPSHPYSVLCELGSFGVEAGRVGEERLGVEGGELVGDWCVCYGVYDGWVDDFEGFVGCVV